MAFHRVVVNKFFTKKIKDFKILVNRFLLIISTLSVNVSKHRMLVFLFKAEEYS